MATGNEIEAPPPGFELESAIPPPPPGFELVKQDNSKPLKPTRGEEMFADIQKARGKDKPEEGTGVLRKAYNLAGGGSGIGATGGALVGSMLAPETGGLSLLIPALLAAGGGTAGAALEGSEHPIREGAGQGALQLLFSGGAKYARPLLQGAKESIVKTFGTRAGVSEAAEGLLKKWLLPNVDAATLYAQGEGMHVAVPVNETLASIDKIVKKEARQAPTEIKKELLDALEPLQKYFVGPAPRVGKSIDVPDLMTEVARLRNLSSNAFKAGKTDLGNALNDVRASMLNDLEKNGAGVVKEAASAYRKEMAIEHLAEQIARPNPGVKLRDYARKDKLFEGAFPDPRERAQIDRIVKKLETVAPSGGAGIVGKIATTTAGTLMGTPGGPAGHAVGMAAGYIAPEYIRTLLASPRGRDFMEKVLADTYRPAGNKVASNIGNVLSIFARGLAATPPEDQ